MPITTILQLIAGAVQVVQSFDGDAKVAKATGYVTEAVGTIAALTPLVQQWASGVEVTLEDARAALAGKDGALARLDDIIAGK